MTMKLRRIILAATLAAFCLEARADDSAELRSAIERLEKTVARLCERVAALEGGKGAPEKEATETLDAAIGQKALAEFVAAQSEGGAELIAFVKSDGQFGRQADGGKSYAMDCQAAVRFQSACIWKFRPDLMTEVNFQVVLPPASRGGGWDNFLYVTQNPGIQVKRGEIFRITGALNFKKTEKGWQMVDFQSRSVTRN